MRNNTNKRQQLSYKIKREEEIIKIKSNEKKKQHTKKEPSGIYR